MIAVHLPPVRGDDPHVVLQQHPAQNIDRPKLTQQGRRRAVINRLQQPVAVPGAGDRQLIAPGLRDRRPPGGHRRAVPAADVRHADPLLHPGRVRGRRASSTAGTLSPASSSRFSAATAAVTWAESVRCLLPALTRRPRPAPLAAHPAPPAPGRHRPPSPSFRRSCSLPGCSACWEEVYGAASAYDLTEGAWRFSWKTWISLSWAALVSVSIRRLWACRVRRDRSGRSRRCLRAGPGVRGLRCAARRARPAGAVGARSAGPGRK